MIRCFLCHRFTSSWCCCIKIESSQGIISIPSSQESRFLRYVEWFGSTYYYDRYIDRFAMVHLWWCQGWSPYASSTTSRNARKFEGEISHTINSEKQKLNTLIELMVFNYRCTFYSFVTCIRNTKHSIV